MKRRLFLGLAAVAILASGIVAGVAWTQVAHAQEEAKTRSFTARLATILGLEVEVVQDAFKEARRTIQAERFQTRMERLVETERITQDEADAAIEWYNERPQGIDTSRRGPRPEFRGQRGPGSKSGFRGQRGPGSRSGFYGQRGPNFKSGFHGGRGPDSRSGFYGQRGPNSKSSFQGRRSPDRRSGFQGRRGPGPNFGFRGQGGPDALGGSPS